MLDIYKTRRKPTPIFYPEGVGGPEIYNLNTAEGKRMYYGNLYKMEVRQEFRCAICERTAGSRMDFDHEQSRGGGKQDDRIEIDGKWKNAALCRRCNTDKGSKRYHWVDGKYVPVSKFNEAITKEVA